MYLLPAPRRLHTATRHSVLRRGTGLPPGSRWPLAQCAWALPYPACSPLSPRPYPAPAPPSRRAEFLSTDAQTLLKGLLTRDPAKRLGAGPHGSEAVKRHPWFKSISWAKLEARQIESKFKPTVTCNMDVGESPAVSGAARAVRCSRRFPTPRAFCLFRHAVCTSCPSGMCRYYGTWHFRTALAIRCRLINRFRSPFAPYTSTL